LKTEPHNEMTESHRKGLQKIMEWYWKVAHNQNLISKEDYELVYDLWNNGVTRYGTHLQKRLNEIREIYNDKDQWS